MYSPISDFYSGRDIFVTGGSGLLGKAILEKLLRSCPGVKRIFVLFRDRHGRSADDRVKELKNNRIFNRLKSENINALDKLIAVPGDIVELGLGLSADSKQLMKGVSIIFHAAATIRFDEELAESIFLNVRGTREALNFALELKNFERFVHVSTAYSYPYRKEIDEKIYDAMADWETNIKMAEKLNADELRAFTNKLISSFPNTYTYTKHLAEHVVQAYSDKLPVAIVRPSVIFCSISEPYVGWYDQFLGVMGIMAGTFSGIIRTMHCDSKTLLDIVPLDECVKFTVTMPWVHRNDKQTQLLPILNSAVSQLRGLTFGEMRKYERQMEDKYSFEKTLWAPRTYLTKCRYDFFLRFYLFQMVPAIVIDAALRLFGQKPFLLRIQRMFLTLQSSYEFFLMRSFIFRTSINSLMEKLHSDPEFHLYEQVYKTERNEDIVAKTVMGCRRYLMRENDESIPRAVRKMKILKFVDFVIQNSAKLIAIYYILRQIYVTFTSSARRINV